jgi:hypothetical protein
MREWQISFPRAFFPLAAIVGPFILFPHNQIHPSADYVFSEKGGRDGPSGLAPATAGNNVEATP